MRKDRCSHRIIQRCELNFSKTRQTGCFYSLYKSLAANKSTFFSVSTLIQLSISLGRIMTFAVSPFAKEYMLAFRK